MNQVALRKDQGQQKLMLLDYMADKYSLRPEEFGKTVRATCGLDKATPEQVAAFLIVAKEYNLNPLTKEIYAFPGRGGGIVPIVSIDGWVNLVNSHPQCDGFDFAIENNAGELYSITCSMHRRDRSHPTVVTEYLSECVRATEPWKMKHRMLRHKAFIQAARYAFGFAGIYDEDEGRTIAEAVDVTPRPRVPSPTEMIEAAKEPAADIVETMPKDDPISTGPQRGASVPSVAEDYDGFVSYMVEQIGKSGTAESLEALLNHPTIRVEMDALLPPDRDELMGLHDKKMRTFE